MSLSKSVNGSFESVISEVCMLSFTCSNALFIDRQPYHKNIMVFRKLSCGSNYSIISYVSSYWKKKYWNQKMQQQVFGIFLTLNIPSALIISACFVLNLTFTDVWPIIVIVCQSGQISLQVEGVWGGNKVWKYCFISVCLACLFISTHFILLSCYGAWYG